MDCQSKDKMTLNDLALAICPLIPEGWKIKYVFSKDEASLYLVNPDGEYVEAWPDDFWTNETILWYVNMARKQEGLSPARVDGIADYYALGDGT